MSKPSRPLNHDTTVNAIHRGMIRMGAAAQYFHAAPHAWIPGVYWDADDGKVVQKTAKPGELPPLGIRWSELARKQLDWQCASRREREDLYEDWDKQLVPIFHFLPGTIHGDEADMLCRLIERHDDKYFQIAEPAGAHA